MHLRQIYLRLALFLFQLEFLSTYIWDTAAQKCTMYGVESVESQILFSRYISTIGYSGPVNYDWSLLPVCTTTISNSLTWESIIKPVD